MDTVHVQRLLQPPGKSFFLLGPRGTGKSTWLKEVFSDSTRFDLLKSATFLELSNEPDRLEALIGGKPAGTWAVIDEIQKLPALLDEVHRLMEEKRWRFALCGSSARKLRRGGVNLLGGRALTRTMGPFCHKELGKRYDLNAALQWGTLPPVACDPKNAADTLDSYVNTYLKEEIKEEGLVRRLPPYLRFLHVAGMMNGQVVNSQNISREASIPRSTVDVYFSILEETLMGYFLPPYQAGLKTREKTHRKFYWFDPGVARAACGLLRDPVDRAWLGFALETLLYHEIRTYNLLSNKHRSLYYYPVGASGEIDFLIETRKRLSGRPPSVVCLEVKLSSKWDRSWERPMRELAENPKIHIDRMVGVYTGSQIYQFKGMSVYPVEAFLAKLHEGAIF